MSSIRLFELQERIWLALHHGNSLDEVDEEIIDAAPFDEEKKAALWLYASAVAKVTPKAASSISERAAQR